MPTPEMQAKKAATAERNQKALVQRAALLQANTLVGGGCRIQAGGGEAGSGAIGC